MKEEEIRQGDIVEIDYIAEFTKKHINEGKAVVIWKADHQPLVFKLNTKTMIWACYDHIARVIGHIDIEKYLECKEYEIETKERKINNMSDKYVIEFDDKEFLIEGRSYRRINGTHTLIGLDDIENLTPAESKEKEKKTIEDIGYGDEYLFIDDCGDISLGIWENTTIDKFRKDSGNVFLTRKEAEFELKRIEIMGIIRKYAEPLDTPWDCENIHYYLVARLKGAERVCINCNWEDKREGFYFATEEDAQKVIDEVGGADLLRYYFMVED